MTSFSIVCNNFILYGAWAEGHLLYYYPFSGEKYLYCNKIGHIILEIQEMYKNITLEIYVAME